MTTFTLVPLWLLSLCSLSNLTVFRILHIFAKVSVQQKKVSNMLNTYCSFFKNDFNIFWFIENWVGRSTIQITSLFFGGGGGQINGFSYCTLTQKRGEIVTHIFVRFWRDRVQRSSSLIYVIYVLTPVSFQLLSFLFFNNLLILGLVRLRINIPPTLLGVGLI